MRTNPWSLGISGDIHNDCQMHAWILLQSSKRGYCGPGNVVWRSVRVSSAWEFPLGRQDERTFDFLNRNPLIGKLKQKCRYLDIITRGLLKIVVVSIAASGNETERSSCWRICRHWLRRKLSLWQHPILPVMASSSTWRSFRFSECLWCWQISRLTTSLF